MISWRDVASVEIETYKIHCLVVHLRDNEFARLAGRDQVSIMLARLAGYLFFTDAGPNTLRISPPLVLTREQADCAVDIIAGCLRDATA